MMKRIAVLAALLGAGCGTVASVRALRPGQSTLAVTAGGPITRVSGKDIPLPYAVARYRYGAGDRLGLYAGAHVLMAAFGVAGLDAGATWKLVGQRGAVPEVGLGAGLVGFAKAGGGLVIFPEASATASWLWQRRFLSYAGVQGMMQASPDVYGAFAPFAGQEVRLWRGLSATLEAKWYAPNEPAAPRVINFRAPVGGHGDIGVLLGLNWQFGGWYD